MGEGSRQYLPDILRLDKEYVYGWSGNNFSWRD